MHTTAELLAPAGDLAKLQTVLRYGADAVYLGGKAFNLRAASQNFSMDQLRDAVSYVHAMERRVYVTLNIIAHNRDLKGLTQFIPFLESIGVDAVIVADPGIMAMVRDISTLPIHVSTQASVANWQTAQVYHRMGAKRVVLARELSLDEIKAIKDKVPELELEVFVHGAMCMTYSGRCNLSSYLSERDSNHGMCSNSCRWKYALVEEKRPGQYFPVHEDESGSFIYNSKDLCTVNFLDKILDAGVSGLKIEGRGRSLLYGATTVKVYREALDAYQNGRWAVDPVWQDELASYHHRGYTSGFFFGKLDRHAHNIEGREYGKALLAGTVIEKLEHPGQYLVHVRNPLKCGQELELLRPYHPLQKQRVNGMWSPEGVSQDFVMANQKAVLAIDSALEPLDILRLRTEKETDPDEPGPWDATIE